MNTRIRFAAITLSALAFSVGVLATSATAVTAVTDDQLKAQVLTGPEAASAVGYNGILTTLPSACDIQEGVQFCGTVITTKASDGAALPEVLAVAKAPTRQAARAFVRDSVESIEGTVVSSKAGVTIAYVRDDGTQTGYGIHRIGTRIAAVSCTATSGTKSAVIRCTEQLLAAQSKKADLI